MGVLILRGPYFERGNLFFVRKAMKNFVCLLKPEFALKIPNQSSMDDRPMKDVRLNLVSIFEAFYLCFVVNDFLRLWKKFIFSFKFFKIYFLRDIPTEIGWPLKMTYLVWHLVLGQSPQVLPKRPKISFRLIPTLLI